MKGQKKNILIICLVILVIITAVFLLKKCNADGQNIESNTNQNTSVEDQGITRQNEPTNESIAESDTAYVVSKGNVTDDKKNVNESEVGSNIKYEGNTGASGITDSVGTDEKSEEIIASIKVEDFQQDSIQSNNNSRSGSNSNMTETEQSQETEKHQDDEGESPTLPKTEELEIASGVKKKIVVGSESIIVPSSFPDTLDEFNHLSDDEKDNLKQGIGSLVKYNNYITLLRKAEDIDRVEMGDKITIQ